MKRKFPLLAFAMLSFVFTGNASSNEVISADTMKDAMHGLSGEQKIDIVMNSGSKLILTNFSTGKKDRLSRPDKMTADEFLPYIAPIDQIYEFYYFLVDEGKPPWEAMYEANVVASKILEEDESRLKR